MFCGGRASATAPLVSAGRQGSVKLPHHPTLSQFETLLTLHDIDKLDSHLSLLVYALFFSVPVVIGERVQHLNDSCFHRMGQLRGELMMTNVCALAQDGQPSQQARQQPAPHLLLFLLVVLPSSVTAPGRTLSRCIVRILAEEDEVWVAVQKGDDDVPDCTVPARLSVVGEVELDQLGCETKELCASLIGVDAGPQTVLEEREGGIRWLEMPRRVSGHAGGSLCESQATSSLAQSALAACV